MRRGVRVSLCVAECNGKLVQSGVESRLALEWICLESTWHRLVATIASKHKLNDNTDRASGPERALGSTEGQIGVSETSRAFQPRLSNLILIKLV